MFTGSTKSGLRVQVYISLAWGNLLKNFSNVCNASLLSTCCERSCEQHKVWSKFDQNWVEGKAL